MRITSDDWLQAQYSVLGAALLDEKIAAKVLAGTEERDYTGAGKTLYLAMRDLYDKNKPLDPVSVRNQLGPEYKDFIVQLMELAPTTSNIDYHIQLCREQARVLAVREIGQQLTTVDTMDDVSRLLDKANGAMVCRQTQKAASMADCLKAFMERPAERVKYLNWPIAIFNDYLRVKPGRFILIGAEPSVGKTAFALQCAWHWARDLKIGFFSLETDPETLFHRLIASVVGIPLENIQDNKLTSEEWDKVCQATQEITTRKLEFIPAAGLGPADIRAKIIEGRYDLVIVDYIQLIPAKGSSRYEIVTGVSIALHNMAQSLGVTIVALSQLSRSDDDHTPKNSDLRESGQLEQDADIIIMLKLAKQSEPAGSRKAFVTKNKEGELFMTVLDFDGKRQTFTKAQNTDMLSNYVQAGKKAKRKNQQAAPLPNQMTVLPDDCKVPF